MWSQKQIQLRIDFQLIINGYAATYQASFALWNSRAENLRHFIDSLRAGYANNHFFF